MSEYFQIFKCEVCGASELSSILNLGLQPMCDDLRPIGSLYQNSKYPINILYCKKCCTAHQQYQIPKSDLFPNSYHYRSRFTADVLRGNADLVCSLEAKVGSLQGLKVLDIGCNDGSLLDEFLIRKSITIGVEPTNAHKDAEGRGHNIINNFFTSEVANKIINDYGKIDIITFTNVFAHIEDLQSLLLSLN